MRLVPADRKRPCVLLSRVKIDVVCSFSDACCEDLNVQCVPTGI
jgi:hypothetical protein